MRLRHIVPVPLLIAAILALELAIVMWARGFSYINLDSLLEGPVRFWMLLIVPSALVVTLVAVTILPRVVVFNIAACLFVIAAAEAGLWARTARTPADQEGAEVQGAPRFYVPDAALGYVQSPSVSVHHWRSAGGVPMYDVRYRTDGYGRRATVVSDGASRASFVLFFGDSNTFGEGLSDTETLAHYAGTQAPAFRPYNYGVSGYGPSHLLTLAGLHRLRREIPERDGYAVFFLIPVHVGRAVGSSPVVATYGRHFPYYRLDGNGRLLDGGDFAHGRPLTTLTYFFWAQSNIASHFDLPLPARYSEADYRLTAKIFKGAKEVLMAELSLRGFVVVLGQAYTRAQAKVSENMRAALLREGVDCLDYLRLFDPNDVRYHLPDYHNSAAANRMIAARLVSDLGLVR